MATPQTTVLKAMQKNTAMVLKFAKSDPGTQRAASYSSMFAVGGGAPSAARMPSPMYLPGKLTARKGTYGVIRDAPSGPIIIPPAPSPGLWDAFKGGVGGFFSGGGFSGAATGFLKGFTSGGAGPDCPPGSVMTSSGCMGVGAGGARDATPDPRTTSPAYAGTSVMGSFGLPAIIPIEVGRTAYGPIRRCPRRMVLGTDELCYPTQVLGRRSKFRKWRAAPRPGVSAQDLKIARKVEKVRTAIKSVADQVDLKVSHAHSHKKKKK